MKKHIKIASVSQHGTIKPETKVIASRESTSRAIRNVAKRVAAANACRVRPLEITSSAGAYSVPTRQLRDLLRQQLADHCAEEIVPEIRVALEAEANYLLDVLKPVFEALDKCDELLSKQCKEMGGVVTELEARVLKMEKNNPTSAGFGVLVYH